MDRDFKANFQMLVCNRTNWKKSRFYSRMRGDTEWSPAELAVVESVYKSFKERYNF
jgi:hypothetical protein